MTVSPEQEGLMGLVRVVTFRRRKTGAAGKVQGWGRGGPDAGFIYFSFLFM